MSSFTSQSLSALFLLACIFALFGPWLSLTSFDLTATPDLDSIHSNISEDEKMKILIGPIFTQIDGKEKAWIWTVSLWNHSSSMIGGKWESLKILAIWACFSTMSELLIYRYHAYRVVQKTSSHHVQSPPSYQRNARWPGLYLGSSSFSLFGVSTIIRILNVTSAWICLWCVVPKGQLAHIDMTITPKLLVGTSILAFTIPLISQAITMMTIGGVHALHRFSTNSSELDTSLLPDHDVPTSSGWGLRGQSSDPYQFSKHQDAIMCSFSTDEFTSACSGEIDTDEMGEMIPFVVTKMEVFNA